jgi:hypothetical protein
MQSKKATTVMGLGRLSVCQRRNKKRYENIDDYRRLTYARQKTTTKMTSSLCKGIESDWVIASRFGLKRRRCVTQVDHVLQDQKIQRINSTA